MTSPVRRLLPKLALFTATVWLNLCAAAVVNPFPEPIELAPDVEFWLDVFTTYSVDEGVLHDNRHLGVVYQRVPMAAALSRRERQRRVSNARKKLQTVLRTLASGKRDNLSEEEARVLALWPEGVSNAMLRSAAGQIRYQQGLKERFRRGLERSGLWREHVHEEFSRLGLPLEIAALPHVESSYNPAAVSHVGASGIWQFTRSTGRRFMRVDHVIDQRNDPFAATSAAAQLMAYNYSITGNWPMAITAYNHGLGGVRRAMREFGDTAYVDILRRYKGRTFGFASRNFYVAFLAAKKVDSDPERYFPGVIRESPLDYSTTTLQQYISAAVLSESLGFSSNVLAEHNQDVQAIVWQGTKHLPKGYELRLPRQLLAEGLAQSVAKLPDAARFAEQLPDLFHTVGRGDTLSQIAQTYSTRVSTLVTLNNLASSNRIRAGQRLRLPAAGPAPVISAEPIEEVIVAAVNEEPAAAEPVVMASDLQVPDVAQQRDTLLSDPSDYSVADDQSIEVHPLETLGHFGDWLQIKTQRLRDLNGLAFRTQVAVGQRIKVDLSSVDAKAFEARRVDYHRRRQDSFFREHLITGVREHTIRSGDAIWIVALRQYDVPLWLFRQYNPGLDLHRIRPGTTVQIPSIVAAEGI